MRTHRFEIAIIFCLAILSPKAHASSTCSAPSEDCVAVGHWNLSVSLGLGSRSNPVVGGSDIPLIVIPKVSYYGHRFFLENLDFGVTLYENDTQGFNLIATPGYDRVFFFRNDPQNYFINSTGPSNATPPGVTPNPGPTPDPTASPGEAQKILNHNRQVTYLVGPEWHFGFRSLSGQLDVLYEATGRYNGAEIRAALSAPLVTSHGTLAATIGGTWKSSELVTYYYGEKGVYDAGAAFNPFVKLSYVLPLTSHWGLDAFVHYERLGDSIASSPIVVENQVTTFFAGVTYSF